MSSVCLVRSFSLLLTLLPPQNINKLTWGGLGGNPIEMVISSRLGLLEQPNKSALEEIIKLTLVFIKTKFPSRELLHERGQRCETACYDRGALAGNEYEAEGVRFG